MNITQEENGKLTATVHINLQEEDYLDNVNKQLKDYRKKAQMPGFRPGMVPMGLVKKMYGKAVIADEVNKTVSEALNNYLQENKINVLGNPLPNEEKSQMIDFDRQKDFDFFFDIGIAPEVKVEISEEIKAPYYQIQIADKEVDEAIKNMQQKLAKEENVEIAEEGDFLRGTFRQMDKEGNVLEGGHVIEGEIAIDDIQLKTVKSKLVGKKKGDKIIFNPNRALKDDDKLKALLQLDEVNDVAKADYEFEIKDVVRKIEAEVDEAFIKEIYPNEDLKTVDEFRDRVRKEIKEHYQKDADKKFVSDVIDILMEKINPELPDDFLKRWLLDSNQGKVTKEQIDKEYNEYAKTFRWQLIESDLISQYGDALRVTKEDVRNRLKGYFQLPQGGDSNPQVEGLIDQLLSNEQEYQRYFAELMDERYIQFFKEKVGKDEKEVTTDEFVKIVSSQKNS